VRISRPCYDKFHRCPGWAGGGCRCAKVQRCEGGHINFDPEQRLWKWRLHRCDKCDVVVLPYVIRWVDPCWWRWQVEHWQSSIENWWWEWTHGHR
jgi:hypothetical protein